MSISRLDLNLLLVLDAVLAEQSIARAADRLHVTPSAISNAMARLRHALGDPLVVRNGRGIVPTPRAAALAPALRRALGDIESAVKNDRFDPLTWTGRFTIAMADALQVSRLPQIEKAVSKQLPRSSLRVVGIDTYLSTGGVAGTEIDAAMLGVRETASGVRTLALYKEAATLVVRRNHPLSHNGEISRRQLATLTHVDVEVAPGHGYRELAISYQRLGIERRIARTVSNFVAAGAVVSQSDHAATLPESLVAVLGARFGLTPLEGAAPKLAKNIWLTWHQRTHDHPAMQKFREVIVGAVGATAARQARTAA